MLSDRGVAPELAPADIRAAWLEGCDWLHVPGYSLAREPLRGAALAAGRAGRPVSVDASSTAAIAEVGAYRFGAALASLSPALVFANEEEERLLDPVRAPTVVVKRGARGCTVRRHGQATDYPALGAAVVDSTGAGDAFAAGFLLGGPDLALKAAARCVAKLGAMP
jgi:sugar/nucleoside kinase (ribokinase family)